MSSLPVSIAVYAGLGLLFFALLLPRIRGDLRLAGRPAAYGFLLLAAGTFIGQGLGVPRITYPFVTWTMYSNPNPDPAFWEVVLERESGVVERASGRLLPARMMNTRGFYHHIYLRGARLEAPEDRDRARSELLELFQSVSDWERARGVDPLRAVSLVRCELGDPTSPGWEAPVCDESTRVDLPLAEVPDAP